MPSQETVAQRVLRRYLLAKEWPSKPALQDYLRQHPKADKAKHWVKGNPQHKTKAKPKNGPKKETPRAPSKAKSTAESAPQPKRHPIQGRGEIQIKRVGGFDKELVKRKASVQFSETPPYSDLMEDLGKSKEAYYARDWTLNWQAESEWEAIDEFVSQVQEPGSWANLKYSAVQTLIEAKKEDLISRGVMDSDGYVTLYRGIGPPQTYQLEDEGRDDDDNGCELSLNRLSSWSENLGVAERFAYKDDHDGKVLKCRIHYTRIVTMWETENETWRDEREWTVMADDSDDAHMECEILKTERTFMAAQKGDSKRKQKLKLDDSNEDWLRKLRLDRLRKKGWKGTLKEYFDKQREQDKREKDKREDS